MLDELPSELVRLIAQRLDVCDAANLSLCCKTVWFALVGLGHSDDGHGCLELARQGWHWPAILLRGQVYVPPLLLLAELCAENGLPQCASHAHLIIRIERPASFQGVSRLRCVLGSLGTRFKLVFDVYEIGNKNHTYRRVSVRGESSCLCRLERPLVRATHWAAGCPGLRARACSLLSAPTLVCYNKCIHTGVDVLESGIRLRQCSHWLMSLLPRGSNSWLDYHLFAPT